MCLAVYVGSDVPLPVVPWDEVRPAFHVADATDGYFHPTNPLRLHSARPYFYRLGSHDGCGCGFGSYGEEWDDAADAYVEVTTPDQRACWRAVAEYLSAALRHQPTVEAFTFCSGDEACPPKRQRKARPTDYLTDRTLFDLWQRVVVSDLDAEPDAVMD